MVQTRIPAPRLVDWVDQAIRYLHVPRNDRVSYGRDDAADQLSSYEVLRRYGIRNATDLTCASRKAQKGLEADLTCASRKAQKGPEADESENALLNILGPVPDGGPPRLSVILHAIEDEEWMPSLLYWRSHDDPETWELRPTPRPLTLVPAPRLDRPRSDRQACAGRRRRRGDLPPPPGVQRAAGPGSANRHAWRRATARRNGCRDRRPWSACSAGRSTPSPCGPRRS